MTITHLASDSHTMNLTRSFVRFCFSDGTAQLCLHYDPERVSEQEK